MFVSKKDYVLAGIMIAVAVLVFFDAVTSGEANVLADIIAGI